MNWNQQGLKPYAAEYDLTNCENEPIHLIRLVQPHACLIACELSDFSITQISDNIETVIGLQPAHLLGNSIEQFLDKATFLLLQEGLELADGFKKLNPIRVYFKPDNEPLAWNMIAHINSDGLLVLEIEPVNNTISTSAFQYQVSRSIQNVQQSNQDNLFQVVAQEIKQVTDYDRVMIYRFDEQYNGTVIAEVKETHLESFHNIKYPASDIPKQARALFLKNKVRIIADVNATNSQIIPIVNPTTQQALDLTYSQVRGVSPIHIEYLQNMGVGATMNVVISIDNQLWGLISCHHYTPKYLDYSTRSICGFIGQIFSGHLALQAANEYRQSVIKSNIIRNSLFEQMGANFDVLEGLTQHQETILNLIDCSGAVVITEQHIELLGKTPSKKEVKLLSVWLGNYSDKAVFSTNELPNLYPPAEAFKEVAAGLMGIKFAAQPNEFVLWFRPEQEKEVFWGGNPEKAVVRKENGIRLSPRKSFEKWKQVVANTARPWERFELDAARALRNDIKEFIVQKFHEIRKLNKETMKAYEELESFSYSVSHDLRAPLRTIEGYAQILKEDYIENMDGYGIEVLNTIVDSVAKMNHFINDILNFSRLGRSTMIQNELDIETVIRNSFKELVALEKERTIELQIPDKLPKIWGDETLLKQLFGNFVSNSIKYTRNEAKAIIKLTGTQDAKDTIITIEDNGIGFDEKYADKIFGVFSRLVGEEEFEGTGVGLAIVKRVIERHDGTIAVKSKLGEGTTFTIKFPIKNSNKDEEN